MANYQANRIRCSKETASRLITKDGDAFLHPIDFRQALDMDPYDKIEWGVSYGWDVGIQVLEDRRFDFGFMTRWFSDLETIKAFITKYPEAEWWINQDMVDIYHYYWQDGEVIEDLHPLTEVEENYLEDLWDKRHDAGDEKEYYDLIFTAK